MTVNTSSIVDGKRWNIMLRSNITHEQVVDLVMALPIERLPSIYDFALFLKQQSPVSSQIADSFGETEEEILTDEALWDQQFSSSLSQLRAMAREAAQEYRSGKSKPMEFDENGRLSR